MRSGEPRVSKNTIIDLSEIRAWLTRCIRERNFEALLVSVIRIVTVLWERNLALQTKVLGARNKPPSERLSTLQGQGVLPGFDRPLSKPSPERGEPDPPTKPERGNPDESRPNHPGRNGFPKHLPRVQRVNPMPEELRHCPKCGVEMSLTGHRKCSYLDVQPARLIVVEQQDEVWSCDAVHDPEHADGSDDHRAPSTLFIAKGKLGATLVIDVLTKKFCQHLPLYRQAKTYREMGVMIDPATLAGHVNNAIDRLKPVAKCIIERVKLSAFLQTDTTMVRTLDDEHPDGVYDGTLWYRDPSSARTKDQQGAWRGR